MDRIFFIILTCRSNYDTKMKSIRESWLKDISSENFMFLADDFDESRRMFYDQRIPLGYDFVQAKYYYFLISLKSLIEIDKFDYFFFVDDDTFVNMKNVDIAVKKLGNNPAWIGDPNIVKGWETPGHRFIGNYEDFPQLGFRYPAGGAGFIANKSLISQIIDYLNSKRSVPASRWSDMTFGVWANNSGGCDIIEDRSLFNNDIRLFFHGSIPSLFDNDHKISIRNSLTFHYVDHDMQRKLWSIVSEK